jgi:hypothetical protein
VGKADMRDFYAILESYEGITTARTIDVEQSIVQMDVAPQMVEVFERILEALAEQIDLSEVPEPAPGDRSSREP